MTLGVLVRILGDTSQLGDALDDGGKKINVFGKEVDVLGAAKMVGLVAAGAVAVDMLKGLAEGAAADRLEAEQLATAIDAAGAATGSWATQVDDAIAAGEALAFTDTQIREALTPLVGVTGDLTRSNELLAIAQDVARLKNIDLATAAEAVAKAEGGQATALAKLTGVNAKGISSAEVLAKVQQRAAGQAEVYGKSTTGQAEAMAIKFDELGETIGSAVLPILDALVPVVIEVVDALAPLLSEIVPPLAAAFGILARGLSFLVRIVSGLIGFIRTLVGWLADAARVVTDFVESLGPVQALGDFLGGLFGGAGLGGLAGTGPAGGPGVTDARSFTVYATAADPDGVVRALRRWVQLNGGRDALERILEA